MILRAKRRPCEGIELRRVMFVTNSLTGGGAERAINILCDQLHADGWDVALLPINSGAEDKIQPRCEIFSLNRTWNSGIFSTLSSWLQYRKVIRDWSPEIIVLNCDLPEFFAAADRYRCEYVAVEHSRIRWQRRRFLGYICRRILEGRKISWVSVSSQLSIWPWGKKPDRILENAVHTPKEHVALLPVPKIARVIFIGRLVKEKNPGIIIELADRLSLEAVFIGEGVERENLELVVREKSLPVTFMGHLMDPWSVVQDGDLLVVPSKSEGDGLVVIEALAARMPLLLANISDFQRFNLDPKHYFADIAELEHKVLEFKDRLYELEVSHEVGSKIVESRMPEKVGAEWEEFLTAL
jgi:GalNAc-alpha-(1->4)-GalNAc-alpha-(1->3)-diNAcBac-PP-undecaprenol alpha-1,4-N-acetyl-D-galactosaminyltransferase